MTDEIKEFREFLDRFENYLNEIREGKERTHNFMTELAEERDDEGLRTYLKFNTLDDWLSYHDQGYLAYRLIRDRFDYAFGKEGVE